MIEVQTKSASLETLSVTIQALHVNSKQMTLAVFRQLPRGDAYREDGTLAPMEFWGVVRYGIKDEGHLWAISASSGRLYRCRIIIDNTNTTTGLRRELEMCLLDIGWWHECKTALHNGASEYSLPISPSGERWRQGIELPREIEHIKSLIIQRENIEASNQALLSLPQLFIAV